MTGRLWLGVVLVLGATLLFALADTTGKHLAATYAVPLILAVRYTVALLLLGVVLGRTRGGLWPRRRAGLVVLRSLCLAAGSIAMVASLQVMPVGETVAIVYLSPFLVMILAGRFLGEKVPPLGWAGAVLAFAGVLLILRPGSGLDPLGVVLSLANACFATAYHLLTRVLVSDETPASLTFNTAIVGTVLFAALTAIAPPAVWPDTAGWGFMAALGIMTTAAHLIFTRAYREAAASVLAPVNFMHVVWAALLGWLVFDHRPDGWTAFGMALVVLGGGAVAVRAGMKGRQDPAA
jgi:drug/metabolite transporter (DMT)-like permease